MNILRIVKHNKHKKKNMSDHLIKKISVCLNTIGTKLSENAKNIPFMKGQMCNICESNIDDQKTNIYFNDRSEEAEWVCESCYQRKHLWTEKDLEHLHMNEDRSCDGRKIAIPLKKQLTKTPCCQNNWYTRMEDDEPEYICERHYNEAKQITREKALKFVREYVQCSEPPPVSKIYCAGYMYLELAWIPPSGCNGFSEIEKGMPWYQSFDKKYDLCVDHMNLLKDDSAEFQKYKFSIIQPGFHFISVDMEQSRFFGDDDEIILVNKTAATVSEIAHQLPPNINEIPAQEFSDAISRYCNQDNINDNDDYANILPDLFYRFRGKNSGRVDRSWSDFSDFRDWFPLIVSHDNVPVELTSYLFINANPKSEKFHMIATSCSDDHGRTHFDESGVTWTEFIELANTYRTQQEKWNELLHQVFKGLRGYEKQEEKYKRPFFDWKLFLVWFRFNHLHQEFYYG